MNSYVDNLMLKLEQMKHLMHELLDNSRIEHFRNAPHSLLVSIMLFPYFITHPTTLN